VDFLGFGAIATAGVLCEVVCVDISGFGAAGAAATAGVPCAASCAAFEAAVFALCGFAALRECFTALGEGMGADCWALLRAWACP
jgi:hypothetical protein